MKQGVILNIQRMSTEDGPGIRTTVFFKGCTLSCKWCHNPESIAFNKEHEWFDIKCLRCGTCIKKCNNGAISFSDDKIVIDEKLCEKCLECTIICPTNSLEAKGKDWTVENLCEELIKDKAYFGNEGGVTLSGGEVLAQSDFAYEVLQRLRAEDIHTAVDTCGHVKYKNIEKVLDATSLFLYDLKIMDSKLHKEYTGADNSLILDNFVKLTEDIRKSGSTKLWVRTPLIPNVTDTSENIRAIADLIVDNSAKIVDKWELLSFNNLCAVKYDRQNKVWEYKDVAKQSKDKTDMINNILSEYSELKDKALVTGV